MNNEDLMELQYVIATYAERDDSDSDLVEILKCIKNCIQNSRNL